MSITTTFINPKRNESTVVSNISGMDETKLTSVSEWKSNVCPEGL
jgi:hypothetical protein